MSFSNEYILNVDVKRRMTSIVPTFKQGDSATLKFRIFDDGKEFDLTDFTRAEITFGLPSGQTIIGEPYLDQATHMIVYKFVGVEMSEVGKLETILSVYSGTSMVSIQPFSVWIFDHLKDKDLSYIGILQDLIAQVELLNQEVTNTLTEANQIKDELNDLLEESNEAETIRNTNEQQRIVNENARKSNETDRRNAEDTRKSNEVARIQNEQIRNTNEQARLKSLDDMNIIINQYKFTGSYNTNVTYKKFNQVEVDGSTYIAITDNTNTPVSNTNVWRLLASKGAKGDKGDTGAALSILGKLTDESQLPPTGHPGDAYTVNGELYVWSEVTGIWENVGNIKGEKGDTGITGEDGKSAYEIAVENGFVGTSEEWLASLKGEKGDKGQDADLTEINQKVDGMQAEVTEHLTEIATTEKLGHFKPDGETLEVDPVTGVAKVIGGSSAKLYQENNITFPTSSAIGNDNFVDSVTFAGICFSQNSSAKTVRVKDAATLYTNSPVSLRRIDGTWIDSIAISKTTVADEVDIKLSDATDMSIAFIQIVQKYEGATTRSNQAFGSFNLSGGANSTAMGKNSIARGHYSLAVGDSTQALGFSSIATGIKSTAQTSNCVALGNNVVASALHSVALGDYSIASGQA
ncbi:BppU family phage baseplate upper protein, partial [Lysinibacillus sp. NPDC086135]|uniref:BppU family phage baseplate upper protein n=1 Tax=Lysinibacillus sp. NPDC086135 TaxID=3364130 RepID=UPI00381E4A74